MNLPPLRLYLKYGEKRHHDEVVEHDAAIGEICNAIVGRSFLHLTNASAEAKEALIADYMRVLAELVRHLDVSPPTVRSAFQNDLDDAVSALKAGEFMAVPSPYDVIEEAGEHYLNVGLQALRVLEPNAGTSELERKYHMGDWMNVAVRDADARAKTYVAWLDQGMPDRKVEAHHSDKDPTHPEARSRWHTEVAPDVRDVAQRKAVVEKYVAYLRRAGTIMDQRRKLMSRYSDPRRRR